MMVATITAAEKPLGKIFCDDYVFNIPPYQRPYSWTTEETSELLTDLLDAFGDETDIKELAPYFLGSIVLIKSHESAEADVVDGQQRLTTLTILFSVLRDYENNTKEQLDIESFIKQHGSKAKGTEDRFRLTIRNKDAEFFQKQIQEKNPPATTEYELTDSQRNIIENRKYLSTELGKLPAATRERLIQFATQRCYLVVVEASDQTSAYRIFSVMNNRGMDLSATDILKADIIGAIEQGQQDKYTQIWENLEDSLGREAFGDLFTHIRMIHRKQKMRETLESEFAKYVDPVRRPNEFIDDELRPAAKAYQIIKAANHSHPEHGKEINRLLAGLHLLDNQDWQPPAILFFIKNFNEASDIVDFLTQLDRLAFSMFVRRANINERLSRYGAILKSMDEGDALAENEFELSPVERIETRAALDGPIYDIARTRKAILLRLDEALTEGVAHYDLPIIQIEHVLPQTPAVDSEWVTNFPDIDERTQWTHRIANLVLLSRSKNQSASNYDFKTKKEKYFGGDKASPFRLTSEVIEADVWTPATLQNRQKRLVDKLVDYWDLHVTDEEAEAAAARTSSTRPNVHEPYKVARKVEIDEFTIDWDPARKAERVIVYLDGERQQTARSHLQAIAKRLGIEIKRTGASRGKSTYQLRREIFRKLRESTGSGKN